MKQRLEKADHTQYQLSGHPGEVLSFKWNKCKVIIKLDKPPTETTSKTEGKSNGQTPQNFIVKKKSIL